MLLVTFVLQVVWAYWQHFGGVEAAASTETPLMAGMPMESPVASATNDVLAEAQMMLSGLPSPIRNGPTTSHATAVADDTVRSHGRRYLHVAAVNMAVHGFSCMQRCGACALF